MKIKAVLFDLYGTLVGFEPSRFLIQSQVVSKYGLNLSEDGVSKGYFFADKFMSEQNSIDPIRSMSLVDKNNFFGKYEQLVLSGDGYEVDIKLCKKIFQELQKIPYSMILYPDVIPTLIRLKESHYKLGLISNMDRIGDELLKEFELSEYIDVCITSKEANAEKPDPIIFNLALKKLGIESKESMYIGDQISSDIEGARNAGMNSMLIDRESSHINYDHEKISTLSELLDLLITQNN
jgi:REG-2-like HAD superfamily hydrolase